MIKVNKIQGIGIGVVVVVVGMWFIIAQSSRHDKAVTTEVTPVVANMSNYISATGNVQPQNRLEIKPPIAGRIEEVLVKEGQRVKPGDILVKMSSTERAALLDAARLQDPASLAHWEEVYKPTLLAAPIDADVIVKSVNPGQAVTASDVVVVLSDRLIVQAQVDETDIGKVKVGQPVKISLDAYPEINVDGVVDHVYYESTLVSNVVIYKVDIVPQTIPDVFRSGMSANLEIRDEYKENVLTLPSRAIQRTNNETYVEVKEGDKLIKKSVVTGITDKKQTEIISGIESTDRVIVQESMYKASQAKASAKSPFMPQRPAGNRRNNR